MHGPSSLSLATGSKSGSPHPRPICSFARTPADCRASSLNLLDFICSADAMTCPFLVTAFQSKQHIQAFLLLSAGTVGVLTVALIVAPIRIPEQDAHSAQLGSRLRYPCPPTAVLLGGCSLSISEPKCHLVFGWRPMPRVPETQKGCGGLQFPPLL